MKVKRLLTVGLMALFCAGTATAASQLNSIQVTPTATTATVSLRTTGSFAHKEYRPEDRLLMVDLTGVTASADVAPAASLNSAVLKSYKVSRYTSASGSEVTRIIFTLADQVTADVNDVSDGLQVILVGAPATANSKTSAASLATPASAKGATAAAKPETASPVTPQATPAQTSSAQFAKNTVPPPIVQSAPVRAQSPEHASAVPAAIAGAPVAIRSVSVRRGQGTLDIVIEGPNSAHAFLLKSPDRLVLDFSNAVVRPNVHNIAVHNKDVEEVRVGRFSSEPPVTRVVVDLKGPRTFDVQTSEKQVIVRVKSADGESAAQSATHSAPQSAAQSAAQPAKSAPAPVLASVAQPSLMAVSGPTDTSKQNSIGPNAALASAARLNEAASPETAGKLPLRVQSNAQPSAQPTAQLTAQPNAQSNAQPSVRPSPDPGTTKETAAKPTANLSYPEAKPAAAKSTPPPPEPPLKAAPAPVLASVAPPLVAAAPVFADFTKPTSVVTTAAPASTSASAIEAKPTSTTASATSVKPATTTVAIPSTPATKPAPAVAKSIPPAPEPPVKAAPAPVLASVAPPVVAAVPVSTDSSKPASVVTNAAPASTSNSAIVAKPTTARVSTNADAVASATSVKPATTPVAIPSTPETKPAPAVAKSIPPPPEPPVKAAPAPVLASVAPPVVAAVPVSTDSSKPTGVVTTAAQSSTPASTPVAPVTAPVVIPSIPEPKPAAKATPPAPEPPLTAAPAPVISPVVPPVVATALSTPALRDQSAADPELRAGIAAGTMAHSSPQETKPAPVIARLETPAPIQFAASAQAASPAPAASAPKYTGEPISVNFKDVDLKDFFRLIHEISGLNIVLDPTVKGSVTLVLDDVPWDQALDIVLKNNGLDRELQGKVLRIAATDTLRREAVDRRAQSEAVALAVDRQTISRYLSYAKGKDVVPIIKKFMTARGDVISDERTNSLIISDIPSVLPNLDRLLAQLDRKTQEVEIEVRVVSATRSFTRDLGFQLGFNWGNGVSAIGGSNPNGATSTSTGSTLNNNNTVPLFSNFPAAGATTGVSLANITATYGIDAILTAAESHNLAKVLSRPRVVTQSNIKAEVKQGVKIPVYTASTANANASVSYVDAVLRLSVTPQITQDGTIFLTVDVENTQPSGQLNGNFILTTQQASTQVLVTDGGTVVIGGVIQTTNSVSTTQTPVLGDIPWLGNLFKQRAVSTETDELIFFITPKIIQT
jgi:type IV pilus assembly protein PilQ